MKYVLKFTDVIKERAWQIPISFDIASGEFTALTGSNGSGKSTIIQLAIGILRPDSGNIQLLGKNPYKSNLVRRKIAVAFQLNSFSAMIPIEESLRLHSRLFKIPWSTIQYWLELFSLSPKSKPFMLSGGQSKRVELLKALAQDAEIYFLDEPMAGLDEEAITILKEWLADMRKKNKAVFLTSHNPSIIDLMDKELNINDLLKGGQQVSFKKSKIVLELEDWKPKLEESIKDLAGVVNVKIELDEEMLSKLGLPTQLKDKLIVIEKTNADDIDMESIGGQFVNTGSGPNLFAKVKIIIETKGLKNTLSEIISILSKSDVRIISVIES